MTHDLYNYLVISHIPFCLDGDGGVWTGDMWLKDLQGMARHLGPITVAAPLDAGLHANPRRTGSFSLARIGPDDPALKFLPLPRYKSLTGFLRHAVRACRLLHGYVARARIVHVATGGWPVPPGEIGLLCARALGRPVVLCLDDGMDSVSMLDHAIARQRSILRKCWMTLTRSQLCRTWKWGARRAALTLFHNPMSARRYGPSAKSHATFVRTFVDEDMILSPDQLEARVRSLYEDRPLRFAMIGRLVPLKGVHHGIEAIARARRLGARVELTVVGDGVERDALQKQASNAGLDGVVRFTGAVPYGEPVFELLRSHDGLLICNLVEELSRNVLLGLAHGCALVAYENEPAAALLRQGINGLLCRRGDVEELARALVTLDSDRELLAALIREGRKTALDNTFDACHRRRAELIRRHVAGVE